MEHSRASVYEGVEQPWITSKETYKQIMTDNSMPRENEIARANAINRKEAIQEVLKERIDSIVKVGDSKLLNKFQDGIEGR